MEQLEIPGSSEILIERLSDHKLWLESNGAMGRRAMLKNCKFEGDFRYSDFREAIFFASYLSDADFSFSDFSNSICVDSVFTGSNFSNTNFSNAELSYSRIDKANFTESNCDGADLRGTSLCFSDFSKSSVKGTILWDADCYCTNFKGSSFFESKITGADFTKSEMDTKVEKGLFRKVAKAALKSRNSLVRYSDSSDPGKSHCLSEWTILLSKNGKELESKYGTEMAVLLLLGERAHFFIDRDVDDIRYMLQHVIWETNLKKEGK